MRLKKGFTLAEILIVLMVIGAIATMTIPSLIRGVQDAQYKTAYKKAYNTILNVSAMERVNGALPTQASKKEVGNFFVTLASYMSVKEFASVTTAANVETVTYHSGVKVTGVSGGDKDLGVLATTPYTYAATADESPWVITDDNFAYKVMRGNGATTGSGENKADTVTCGSKSLINSQTSASAAYSNSCLLVMVDVNGLEKAPNGMNEQAKSGITNSTTALAELTGDRYYIYIGNDGATAGPKDYTATGRIVADIK